MKKALSVTITEEQARIMHVLAQEIARGYLDREQILKNLGMTEEDYEEIEQLAVFQKLLTQAVTEWNAASNSAKRIKLKSQWAVEESIPSMVGFMTDNSEPMAARVEAFKTLARIGGLGNPDPIGSGSEGGGFHIEINIGQGVAPITIDSSVLPAQTEDDLEPAPTDPRFEINFDPPGYEPKKFSGD